MLEIDSLKLKIKPDWAKIEEAYEKCRDFLNENKFNLDIIDAVSMITSELIENAVKYGAFDSGEGVIDYTLRINKKDIIVEVKNPVDDTVGRHLKRLDEIVQWIRGYQNPFEVYVKKLKEVSTKSFSDDESCLGLVRIAYEGQSILDFYLDHDNTLSVSAIHLNQ